MTEEFVPPTYEEYTQATKFARVKYKYGMMITIACWICLVILIIYLVLNIEEMKQHPIPYGIIKTDNLDECYCNSMDGSVNLYANKTGITSIDKINYLIP